MIRPSFQFYPADWRNNAKLRRCSEGARGAWMDVLCVLHDSDEYGVCRWPLADIARAAGVPVKYLKELVEKDVLKGGDKGCDPYVYTPVSGRVHGQPVTLVESEENKPCWYCSRFVRDEYIRQRRGNNSQFSSDNQPSKPSPKSTPKVSPKPTFGERQGDGSISSSSSSIKTSVNDTLPKTPDTPGASSQTTAQKLNGYGPIAVELIALGVQVTSIHPTLQAWVDEGFTIERLRECVAIARQSKPSPEKIPANYLDRIVREPPREAKAPKPKEPQWWASEKGIEAKGRELGLRPKGGESWNDFKARINEKLRGNGNG